MYHVYAMRAIISWTNRHSPLLHTMSSLGQANISPVLTIVCTQHVVVHSKMSQDAINCTCVHIQI